MHVASPPQKLTDLSIEKQLGAKNPLENCRTGGGRFGEFYMQQACLLCFSIFFKGRIYFLSALTFSQLNPMVGIVLVYWPNLSLYNMVVLPLPSSPIMAQWKVPAPRLLTAARDSLPRPAPMALGHSTHTHRESSFCVRAYHLCTPVCVRSSRPELVTFSQERSYRGLARSSLACQLQAGHVRTVPTPAENC